MTKKARGTRRSRARKEAARRRAEAQAREKESRITREVAVRALWRLNLLEYLILFAALVLALMAGALVAWLLTALTGFSFRIGWALSSLLLFIVPGGTVYLRELRREKGRGTPDPKSEPKDIHG